MEKRFQNFARRYQWLLMLLGALMAVGSVATLVLTRSQAQQMALDTSVKSLKGVVHEAFLMIDQVEKSVERTVTAVEQQLDDPDAMYGYSRLLLEHHPYLSGCSISFEPDYFKSKGRYFSAHAYRDGDSIVTEQEGNDRYQYFYTDKYLIPRQLDKKHWVEPFAQYNSDGSRLMAIMTSCCLPLHNPQGKVVGVLSVDMPMKRLSDTILVRHPFPQSYCMMVGRGGAFIVHPDSSRLIVKSVLTDALVEDDPALTELGRAMLNGETGRQALRFDGVLSHVFYMPFAKTGWSLALVCPDFVLMKRFYLYAWGLVFLTIISLIIMLTPLWNYLQRRRSRALTGSSALLLMLLCLFLGSCSQEKAGLGNISGQQTDVTNGKNDALEAVRDRLALLGQDFDPNYFKVVDSLQDASAISAAEADYWRANQYQELQKTRTSILYYKKALANDQLKTESPEYYYMANQGLYTASINSSNVQEAMAAATRGYQAASEDTTAMGQKWASVFMSAIASSQLKLGNIEDADKNFAKAREGIERLAMAHPDVADYQRTCLTIASNILNMYFNRREFEKALPWEDMLEQALERLAATDASMDDYSIFCASIISNKAVLYAMTGRPEEAEAEYQNYLATDYANTYSGIYDQAYYLEITEQWDKLLDIQLRIDSSEVAEGVTPSLDYLIESPATTFKALEKTGRKDEALKKADQIIQLLDTVKAYQHNNDAEELAAIFETQQKEEQIARQQAELSQQKFKWFAVLLVLLVVFFFVYTQMQRRAERRLSRMKAAQDRIEGELKIARDIQMSMVPHDFPRRDGLDMYASMTPAREVGGDLYGYVLQGDDLYFAIGDVSGKGVPASLFMAQATSLFRTLASQGIAPADICTLMNDTLSGDNNESGMFVTFFLGLLNLKTGHLSFCNAGHNPPVLGGDADHGNFLQMESNAPIGLWPDLKYVGEEIENIKGHPLFIYTDGLNEAENRQQEQFGDDRLLSILRNTRFDSSHQVIETLAAEVEKHRAGAEPNDDLTMMCIDIK